MALPRHRARVVHAALQGRPAAAHPGDTLRLTHIERPQASMRVAQDAKFVAWRPLRSQKPG